jgi:hypothetical protein
MAKWLAILMAIWQIAFMDYEITAFRFISKDCDAPSVGDCLENSFHWDGDIPTDRELNGVCAFDSLDKCQKYAEWSKGWVLKIGGDFAGHGEDMVGEVLVRNAVVLDVTNWRM